MMKTVYPNYYQHFSCIADKCRHNCCIGWEIDIDEDTLSYYDALGGAIGKKMQASIRREEGCACFALDERERCPFLREDNLCEIIVTLGEDALCDICTDHPRFRHFFSRRTELGLGLACESAAALILAFSEKMCLLEEGEGGEEEETAFFLRREKLFELAQNRDIPLDMRMQTLLCKTGAQLPDRSYAEWADVYESLERMDESFVRVIDRMKTLEEQATSDASRDVLFERLLVYFLYRHLMPECEREAVGFCVHATRLLRALCEKDKLSFEETVELCRLYSSEIEYSEENTDALFALFS